VNILRRLPLSRLLLLCSLVLVIGVSATALALAVSSGPVPRSKPLAQAIHDALAGPSVEGVTASVTLTDHLLEGASLSGAGGLTSSPLVAGASGRLWVSKDGRVRLELQASGGDTQILYDGHTIELYDASTNTLYRYAPPASETQGTSSASASVSSSSSQGGGSTQITSEFKPDTAGDRHEVPSVAKIEEAISHAERHSNVSGATPTDIGGQPAYTVRISPKEGGSLFDGVELSFDAVHGLPLSAGVYSSTSSAPVIELTAGEVSYGPVEASVFAFSPPSDAKVLEPGKEDAHASGAKPDAGRHPKGTTYGHGLSSVEVLESTSTAKSQSALGEGLPKVKIDGVSASELATSLGTVLSFERSGVRYLLFGSVAPADIEAVARGL
jgi:outer membrane lipoprotein-sorting protein